MKALAATTALAVLTASGVVRADPVQYSISATATLSQFSSADSHSYTGSGDTVATLPGVSASVGDGPSTASASATSRVLSAGFSTTDTGIDIHSANASASGGGIAFTNDAAYQNLFGGALTMQVLLNFDFSYVAMTDNVRSSDAQATVSDHFSVFVQGAGTGEGSVSVLNDGFGHSANGYGLLAGLGEGSGSRMVSIPVTLTIFNASLFWSAEVDVGGLALGEEGFAVGQASLTLPAAQRAVTTLDGTPLTSLGVQLAYVPATYDDDNYDPTPVPEPASLAMLGFGLAALVLGTGRRRHKGAAGPA